MNQVSETCSLCNKPNDQMLMLSCVHDPCINCAASAYAEQIHIKGQSREVYVCEICGEETLLDSTTVGELSAIASTLVKLPSKQNAIHSKNATNNTPISKKKQSQFPAASSNNNAQNISKKIVYYCKEHSEEEITYYCFTCCTNICPQCAIHGTHKDHEVKLIKKAISQVKGEYMDLVSRIGESQSTMGKMKEGFLRMIKDNNDRNSRQRNIITRQFDMIRATLAAKQKELLKELDDINKANLSSLTSFLDIINTNYEESNKVKRSIDLIIKKDEVLILEDYRKIGDLETSLVNLNKSTDSIAGTASHLNIEFLQQQCKEVVDSIGLLKINLKRDEVGASSIIGVTNGASRVIGGH